MTPQIGSHDKNCWHLWRSEYREGVPQGAEASSHTIDRSKLRGFERIRRNEVRLDEGIGNLHPLQSHRRRNEHDQVLWGTAKIELRRVAGLLRFARTMSVAFWSSFVYWPDACQRKQAQPNATSNRHHTQTSARAATSAHPQRFEQQIIVLLVQ